MVLRIHSKRRVFIWGFFLVYSLTAYTTNNLWRRDNILEATVSSEFKKQGRRLLVSGDVNCTPPAIEDFPRDLFTPAERESGAVFVHVIVAVYLLSVLSVVCDVYFVPSLELICERLHLNTDVAGATFMAAGTSSPELFTNVVGTFITEGDLGVGTIVGSAVFNILAVVAVCGLGAGMTMQLDWWPLTRDCIAYGITVILLIIVINDETIMWYEALILVLVYILYILVMYFNNRLESWAHKSVDIWKRKEKLDEANEKSPLLSPKDPENAYSEKQDEKEVEEKNKTKEDEEEEDDINDGNPFSFPKGTWQRILWLVMWPASLLLFLTIPDCRRKIFKNFYMATFTMCVIWIGSLSYVISWMITVIGHTSGIPDSVMGLTFLAAGTSVPEVVSSLIVAREGLGSMAVSNSIGSNTFDILLCLGLPWLIKASFLPSHPSNHVIINSSGFDYTVTSLFASLVLLYVVFACNKFVLDKKVGGVCLLMYIIFLVILLLFELNVFFVVNLPVCPSDF